MPTRSIETEDDVKRACVWIAGMKRPFTLQVQPGRRRSTEQNRTQHLWYAEIAEQKGDMTTYQVRAYCKLHFGIPILRAENELFRDKYDRIIRPLAYEAKMELMSPPIDLPVTSLFTVKQETAYLDLVQQFAAGLGIRLTQPEAA